MEIVFKVLICCAFYALCAVICYRAGVRDGKDALLEAFEKMFEEDEADDE